MGSALMTAQPKRYMGGKLPNKFFIDDMWPIVDDLFLKLNIAQYQGFRLFKAFTEIDVDESGTVEQEESLKYFGGNRTKFTERLFFSVADNGEPKGFEFKEWAIELYGFCSLSLDQIAQYAFEIFDVDGKGSLERADVEAMYRMLYDCDDFDPYYVNEIPWDSAMSIAKPDFIAFAHRKRHIIQPILAYQSKLRRLTGGRAMWESLMGFRRRYFQVHDTNHPTIAESNRSIILSEDVSKRRRHHQVEKLLKDNTLKLQHEAELADRELKQRERQMLKEKKMATRSPEQTRMKKCWHEFDTKRNEFKESEYTVEDVWQRREHRLALFTLLDAWFDAASKHWAKTDKATVDITLGTDEDHLMRYLDFLSTPEGKNLKQAVMLRLLLQSIRDKLRVEKDRLLQPKKDTGMQGEKTTMKDIEIKTSIEDLTVFIDNFDVVEEHDELAQKAKGKHRTKGKGDADALVREKNIASKYSKPADLIAFESQADDWLRVNRREALVKSMWASLDVNNQERKRDFLRKEFELATSFGSRITRWEFVFNPVSENMVYVNVDTMEWIHRNSAICEKCDAIFEQFDLTCLTCGSSRSSKNARLYRPLGMKDIRVD